ncbi:MAG: tRNA pseudouridine(38-40) synthase TruA [Candidatus Krumholzibacteria bacterium]|nr:tRNA pseudouridine(38-40) synthase TruA [Candidatus Krumholzibacteria bacterium]
MRNFKLLIEYDGTDFHGWQKQPSLRTVQGVMEDTIYEVFGKPVPVNGAGRTDAGVHALGQVANLVVDTTMSVDQTGRALAAKLPEDIQVYHVKEVDLDFHARFSAKKRRYTYYLRTEPTAIWRRFAYVVTAPLDIDAMRKGSQYLIGEKDFASFTPSRSNGYPTHCNLMKLSVTDDEEIISIGVEADHFLHNMVRVIVGTLIEIGRGRIQPEHVEQILRKKNRAAAGPTIPPNGLFLMEVVYDE